MKSHQFCCFQSVSWGGASQGGRINFRCTMQNLLCFFSKYHSFVVFFLLIPCGTCCHELSRNFVLPIQKGRNMSVYSWVFGIHSICGLLPPSPPRPEIFSIGDALNQKLCVPHAQSIYRNILPTIPPKSYSPVLEMLASGRLPLNCAARLLPHWRQTAAKLLPCIATYCN